MNEKSFEEKFPSLRSKTLFIDWAYQEEMYIKKGEYPKGEFVKRTQIVKHCLDKEKVREAICNLTLKFSNGLDYNCEEINNAIEKLLKELKLG